MISALHMPPIRETAFPSNMVTFNSIDNLFERSLIQLIMLRGSHVYYTPLPPSFLQYTLFF